jgi:hypothetical protein
MEFLGHVRNGVVVLDGNPSLPEGAAVTVHYPGPAAGHPAGKARIQVPLVRTGQPGSVHLTGERIAEILGHPGTSRLTNQRIAEMLAEEDVGSLPE